MGCLYWLLIGWWLEPIKCVFKLGSGFINGIIKFFLYIILIMLFGSMIVAIGGFGLIVFIAISVIVGLVKFIFLRNNKYKNVDFDSMTGYEFENFCSFVLKDNGFSNVTVTKSSGDHGVDILANKSGKKYAIQCKCYSNNVGNKAVQEIYAGRDIYGADVAVVMTNNYFTNQAKSDAGRLGVKLWDRSTLKRMIYSATPKTKFEPTNEETENETSEPLIVEERIYHLFDVVMQFELYENNDICVLITDTNDLRAVCCMFFELYMEFKKYKETHNIKLNYKISTRFDGKAVICNNLYIWGKNSDGSISRTIPDWLDKARHDSDLDDYKAEYYGIWLNETKKNFDDFMKNVYERYCMTHNAYSQNSEDLERFAMSCNAYLEHEDEMEQYRDYFNIPYDEEDR